MKQLASFLLLICCQFAVGQNPFLGLIENKATCTLSEEREARLDFHQLALDFQNSVPLRAYELQSWYRGSAVCYNAAVQGCIQPEVVLHSTDGSPVARPRIVITSGTIGQFAELSDSDFDLLVYNYKTKVQQAFVTEASLHKDSLTSSANHTGKTVYFHARKSADGRILVAGVDSTGLLVYMFEFTQKIYPASAVPAVPVSEYLGGFQYDGGFQSGEIELSAPRRIRQVRLDLSQCPAGTTVAHVEATYFTASYPMERYSSLPYFILPQDKSEFVMGFRITLNGGAANCGVLAYKY